LYSDTSWLTLNVQRSDYAIREKTVFAILGKWPKLKNRIDELLDRGDQRPPEQRQDDHSVKSSEPQQEGKENHPIDPSKQAQEEQEDPSDESSRLLQRDQAHYSAKLERALQSSTELLHDWEQLQPDGEVADKLRGKMRTYQDRLRDELAACTTDGLLGREAVPSLAPDEESELQAALGKLTYKPVSKKLIAMWVEEESLRRYTPASRMNRGNMPRISPRSVAEDELEDSGYGSRDHLRWYGRPPHRRNSTVDNLVAGMRNMWTKLRLSRSGARRTNTSEWVE